MTMSKTDDIPSPEPPGLYVVSRREHQMHTMELAGELDVATCPRLRRELREAEAQGPHTIVIDLSRLGFIDSSGLKLLIEASIRNSRDGSSQLAIVRGSRQIQRVFEIAGVEDRLPFLD
jgi:anti-anti-sigma factor